MNVCLHENYAWKHTQNWLKSLFSFQVWWCGSDYDENELKKSFLIISFMCDGDDDAKIKACKC